MSVNQSDPLFDPLESLEKLAKTRKFMCSLKNDELEFLNRNEPTELCLEALFTVVKAQASLLYSRVTTNEKIITEEILLQIVNVGRDLNTILPYDRYHSYTPAVKTLDKVLFHLFSTSTIKLTNDEAIGMQHWSAWRASLPRDCEKATGQLDKLIIAELKTLRAKPESSYDATTPAGDCHDQSSKKNVEGMIVKNEQTAGRLWSRTPFLGLLREKVKGPSAHKCRRHNFQAYSLSLKVLNSLPVLEPHKLTKLTQYPTRRPTELAITRNAHLRTPSSALPFLPHPRPNPNINPHRHPRFAEITYTNPIDRLLDAITNFELSIEIRDRLTHAELTTFDKLFVAKAKELGASGVEGSYSQQLQALKRLTKARAHLRGDCPGVVEDLDAIVGRLLGMLGGEEGDVQASNGSLKRGPQQIVSHPRPSVAASITSSTSTRTSSDKIQLSSISTDLNHLRRSAGHKLYLRLNDKEGYLEIKGINSKLTAEIGDKKIACAEIKSLGDISDREISIGIRDGGEVVLELRDEKDAEALIQWLEAISGVTAYTARCY
ncbi:hypothetical protein G7Y79_00009g025810 [Physcia stellaris]|nr:hypothetical protein G7Y79_00009g025810 [Physcia stellaris]